MPEPRYDVAIIGAGVIGLSVARELLRRDLSVLVIDKEHDVGRGASGRNSGVIHPGFSVAPGTLKARLNVEGSRRMREVCAELDVPFEETGTLVVAASSDEVPALQAMLDAGRANGLERLAIIGADELAELEPAVSGSAALYSPEGTIISPHALVFRVTESCLANGCDIALNTEVRDLTRDDESWILSAPSLEARARLVVNAAGVAAPHISRLARAEHFDSHPCRGEYLVLDRLAQGVPGRMVYPVPPESGGLGVHFTPTIDGNTLIGPSAEYLDTAEDFRTTPEVLARLFDEATALCPDFDPADVIASFAGVRAKISRGTYGESDFVIENSRLAPGLINLVGIESPGLSSSPAIAEYAAGLVLAHFPDHPAGPAPGTRALIPISPVSTRFADLSDADRRLRAEADPDSRAVVCRCEEVTRAEVLAALRNPLGAQSLAAVKTRCHAGMGRCQGGFCTPRVIDIMRNELGIPAKEITLKGPSSEMLSGETKELFR